MKKKLLSLMMAVIFVFTTVIPSFADVKEDYFNDMKKVYEKSTGKAVSNQEWSFQISGKELKDVETIKAMGIDDLDMGLKIKVDSKATEKPIVADIKVNVDLDLPKFLLEHNVNKSGFDKIPEIRMIMDEDNIYLNKDFVNFMAKMSGADKNVVTEDFAKIKTGLKDILNAEQIKDMLENQDKMYQASLNFLKKIDLKDAKLNLVKTSDGVYESNLNSDELVDLVDAFIRFVLSDFKAFLDFYKELGIDYIEMMNKQNKAIGLPEVSEEEMIQKLKEAYTEYDKVSKEYIAKAKKVLKGTTLYVKEDFSKEGEVSSDMKLNLVIDFDALDEVTNSNLLMGAKGKLNLNMAIKSSQKYVKDLEIKAPEKAQEIDPNEIKKEIEEGKKRVIEFNTRKNEYSYYKGNTLAEVNKIDVKLKDGKTVVNGKELVDLLSKYVYVSDETKNAISGQKEFNIRDIEKYGDVSFGLKLGWNEETKSVQIVFSSRF